MIKVTLGKDYDKRFVYFDLFNTDIARKWQQEIKKNYPIFESDRFTGWPDTVRTKKWYSDELNKCIDIINTYKPDTIKHRAAENMLPEHTNYLHKYFEELRGGVLSPAQFFTDSPEHVKTSIQDYNVLIHAYEKIAYSPMRSPTITCTFNCERQQLSDEDYEHFTYDWRYGTIYINYCEVGKHLLELFLDKDDIVGDNNIRPLKYYSADFKIKFGANSPPERYTQFSDSFEQWFSENESYFNSLGIYKDKYRALGLIPVAQLNREASGFIGYNEQDIIDDLAHYNKVISVNVI